MRRLEAENLRLADLQRSQKMLKEEVEEEDIAEVVSKWTGIPVSRLVEGEVEKLIHMEERLHRRVVGQDDALEVISNALRRARSGLQDPNRPSAASSSWAPRAWVDRTGPGVGRVHVRR